MSSACVSKIAVLLLLCLAPALVRAQQPPPKPSAKSAFDQVVDRIIEQEHSLIKLMSYFHPVAETYLQNVRPDENGGLTPVGDDYFLGQLTVKDSRVEEASYLRNSAVAPTSRILSEVMSLYGTRFSAIDFARTIFPDVANFDRQHYDFTFVRREYLGDVRCLLIEVVPRQDASDARFLGRIWVEDQDNHIVRFNGAFPARPHEPEIHFDSWRLNLLANNWLPAYGYSEDSYEPLHGNAQQRYRAQTRIWGYDLEHAGDLREYAQPLVDSVPEAASGKSDPGYDLSPTLSHRRYQYSGEDNVVERLQIAGLMAPSGSVNEVLETVVRNIEITNKLEITPEPRCRVLLTAPLESFSVGRTIVVSRGLLDVLPDEATLAMVLAHEMAHIILGHAIEGKYSAPDNLFFQNEQILDRLNFHLDPAKEDAANAKAMQLLKKSPYADKLGQAGLFLKQLQFSAPNMPSLMRPNLGNGLIESSSLGPSSLQKSAPEVDAKRTDQIAALPLGSRVKLDPWSDRIELTNKTAVPLNLAKEKIPFQVTPFYPYLRRLAPAPAESSRVERKDSK
jgi:hypothetical protein